MEEDVRQAIASRLREFRQSLGLSQIDLARQLKIKQRQSVSAWENGKSLPRGEEWVKLGRLGMSLDYVVLGIRTVPVSRYASPAMPPQRRAGEDSGIHARLPAS